MSIVSFHFLAFLVISILFYYITPRKFRWFLLVIYTVIFFSLSAPPWTAIYLIANIVITYCSTRCISKAAIRSNRGGVIALTLGLVGDVGILAVLKYGNFFIMNLNKLLDILGIRYTMNQVNLISPIGISFYTLISVGYILDCYWEVAVPEKIYLKQVY